MLFPFNQQKLRHAPVRRSSERLAGCMPQFSFTIA
nr:MAG TPA: hypothetical protein [Caudoviricetes sp.]